MTLVSVPLIEALNDLPAPQHVDELERHVIETVDLGAGLRQEATVYLFQEREDEPAECYGRCVAFSYRDLTIEMDTEFIKYRKVGMLKGDTADHLFSAAEWVKIAELVRRDEVYAALQQWAAEDAQRVR